MRWLSNGNEFAQWNLFASLVHRPAEAAMSVCFVLQSLKWWIFLVRGELPSSFLVLFSVLFCSFNLFFPEEKNLFKGLFHQSSSKCHYFRSLFVLFFFFLAGRSQSNSSQPTVLPRPASPNLRMQIESLTKLRLFKEKIQNAIIKNPFPWGS